MKFSLLDHLSLPIDSEHQVLKTLTSIVPVYNVLECLTGIPFNVFWLFAGFQLNQDSTTILLQDKMGVDVATSSLRFHGDFPALWSEEMHDAKEVNMIDALWSFETNSASYLGDCLRIKMLLHKN